MMSGDMFRESSLMCWRSRQCLTDRRGWHVDYQSILFYPEETVVKFENRLACMISADGSIARG